MADRNAEHACGDCPLLAHSGASCARLSFASVVRLLPRGFTCLIDAFDGGASERDIHVTEDETGAA
ncbi:MAG: hypothetical protein AAFP78_14430 [Pseudomonadota bacterium]